MLAGPKASPACTVTFTWCLQDEVERPAVRLGRIVLLGPGEVEPHDAPSVVRDRQLREPHGEAGLRWRIPQMIVPVRMPYARSARRSPADRLDGLFHGEPLPRVERRAVAHLHVADVLPWASSASSKATRSSEARS